MFSLLTIFKGRLLKIFALVKRKVLFPKFCLTFGRDKRLNLAAPSLKGQLWPGLNASIVQLVLHIWQGYLTFSYYFIFDRIGHICKRRNEGNNV